MRRAFSALFGLGAGVALGVWAIRKLEAVQARLTPEHAARRAAERASSLRMRLAEARAAYRAASTGRESELRAAYGGGDTPPSRPVTGSPDAR